MVETRTREPHLRLTLSGPAIRDGRLPLAVLVDLGHHLQTAVTRVALSLRGQVSPRRGRPPADVATLTRLEFVGFRGGSAILELDLAEEARPLAEFDLGLAALDAFERGLEELARDGQLPLGWDAGVLVATKKLFEQFDRGVDTVVVERPQAPVPRTITVTARVRERITSKLVSTVERNRMTVEGRLLMADFDETRNRCRLHPPLGAPIMCTFTEAHRDAVRDLVTEYVRVTGEAELDKATGTIRLLRIADIEPTEAPPGVDASAFWQGQSIEELTEAQGVTPVRRLEDLTADLWESDEDLEDFLGATYESRDAGVA